jgi:putative transposase
VGIDQGLVDLVVAAERKHHQHPVALEAVLRRNYGLLVPHNRIWRILRGAGFVKATPAKQERRKWIRWQRKHSNSLWQLDYTQLGLHDWLLLILDDASRLLVGWARVKTPTAQVAWDTFSAAAAKYGFPRQVLTDNGTQFVKAGLERVGFFDRQLRELRRGRHVRIQHIRSRVKHPQTGGKIERVIGTVKSKLRARFPDGEIEFPDGIPEIVHWYNTDKPHLSLRFKEGETPAMAFRRKWHPKRPGRPTMEYLLEVS